MKKFSLLFAFLPLTALAETDAGTDLDYAISKVRAQCSGISAKMEGIKKMAGIGTAVNAVGTVAGAGGVVSGVVKYEKDLKTAKAMGEKAGIELVKDKLKNKELSSENQKLLNRMGKTAGVTKGTVDGVVVSSNLETHLQKLAEEYNALDENKQKEKLEDLDKEEAKVDKKIKESQKASTTAGNIRTGLFAVDTMSNVAGAVVSSKTVADDDLVEQIKKCTESLDVLRNARTRAKAEQENVSPVLMEVSQKMLDKCSEYEYVNVQKLNNLGKGAMISNSIGAVTGTAATVTSAMGNNKKMSEMDIKNENGYKEVDKYAKINVTSNVLGGVTAAASLSGTILNASQIKTVKQIVNISQECEGALTW